MTSGAGSSVYSLSQHHDRKKRKAEKKARKMAESANKAEKRTTKVNTIVIQEANVEDENNTGRENCFKTIEGEELKNNELHEVQTDSQSVEDQQQMEVLGAISCCISEMSMKYEVMGQKFTQKLDQLETTSVNLTRKFEALQQANNQEIDTVRKEKMKMEQSGTIETTQCGTDSIMTSVKKRNF